MSKPISVPQSHNPMSIPANNVDGPKILKIDRSKPFDPVKFISIAGWTIEEQDENSLKLEELDLTKVRFETGLNEEESSIQGEEKLRRLKTAGHIRLDANVLRTLWENQTLIPASWKEPINGNARLIYFDGTILRDSGGHRFVLCLRWNGGEWNWRCCWLDYGWSAGYPSAVLAS